MNDQIISDIRQRGHWLVVIRAAAYNADRIAFEDLQPTLERSIVNMRGWKVPHINSRGNVKQAANYIFQSSSYQHYLEHWRFYQSGQFIQLAGMKEDWRDQSGQYPRHVQTGKQVNRLTLPTRCGATQNFWNLHAVSRLQKLETIQCSCRSRRWVLRIEG